MTQNRDTLPEKRERLKAILAEMGNVLVAYSGGVDSTLLLKVAHDVLGDRVVAVMNCSAVHPGQEVEAARELAREIGVRLICIETDELHDEAFTRNDPERCYFCKAELIRRLKEVADREGLEHIVHGANVDDTGDFRPGQRAADEMGVRAPLQEADMTKEDIRTLSRELGLPTWDKPSFACLASRFPYGMKITPEALEQVDKAEELLRSLGFRQFRVRHHGPIARIEVEPECIPRLMEPEVREKVAGRLKELGYLYVTVDMEGYRTGSMNEEIRRNE